MISRRNIRIKVMQALYALESVAQGSETDLIKEGAKLLHEKINRSSELFALTLLYVSRVAQYAESDSRKRASKYLATEYDRQVNTKIAGNTFLWLLLENNTFSEQVKAAKLEQYVDGEWVKKLYNKLVSAAPYQQYISEPEKTKASEKSIIQYIWFDLMKGDEDFESFFADEWNGWEDDKDMLYILMENYFRSPKHVNFLQFISSEKATYAQSLLRTVIEKEEYTMELIKPRLKNWEAERVALVDLILLKMGLCELLYFPTIPTKVTINEYIEIAKRYSTMQSGQFVNGVLDNLLKELTADHKIRKIERTKESGNKG